MYFWTLTENLVLPAGWWVQGLQLHCSEAAASAAPSGQSLCVHKQPKLGHSNMEAQQATPREVSQLCRERERGVSTSTRAKIFRSLLKKRNFFHLSFILIVLDNLDESGKRVLHVSEKVFAPCWVTIPFVVAHRKEGDELKLNRLPLTLSSEGRSLQTKVRVADYNTIRIRKKHCE